ncbi:Ivy family c-type lysozyme inhibitor [Brucella pseudogrignonensis]|uniref:Ivy family c-type lysozyme inhibitor n=1 Tax=Brucella pseudogrignonensis TaxID=419475 RepID=UPI0038CF40C5
MKLSLIVSAMVMFLASPALATGNSTEPPADLTNPAIEKRVEHLVGKNDIPKWLKSATLSEGISVKMDGKPYTVLVACKPHDCSNNQFAVLFDKEQMFGLLYTASEKPDEEKLTWFNIGGGPESIDGKTLLYAAITGSLANHPEGLFDQ